MARGGLAGIWDRNKKIITPIAELLAGAVNPALGAAVGAGIRGLDRPGQRGVGFDVKQGIRGGIEGYGMGQLGSAAKTGIGALAGKLGSTGAAAAGNAAMSGGISSNPADYAVDTSFIPKSAPPGGGWMDKIGNMLGGKYAPGNPNQQSWMMDTLAGVGKGAMDVRSQQLKDAEAARARAEQARQFDATLAQRSNEFNRSQSVVDAQEAARKRAEDAMYANRAGMMKYLTGGV